MILFSNSAYIQTRWILTVEQASFDRAAAEHLQFYHNLLVLLASNYQAMGMKIIAFDGLYFLHLYVL